MHRATGTFRAKIRVTISLFVIAAAASNLGAMPPRRLKIAFFVASLDADRFDIDRQAFIAYAEAHGADVSFGSAGGDPIVQAESVSRALEGGIDAVVIQPVDPLRAEAIVLEAHQRKIPVIAYDRFIASAALDLYVTHDHYQLGVLQGEALARHSPKGGAVVICMGQKGSRVAEEITRGNEAVLNASGFTVVSKRFHASWSPDDCEASVLHAIYDGPIVAVLANNSRMAVGALEALTAHHLVDRVFIAGGDLTTASCRALAAGHLQFDVFKPITQLAELAAASALQLARGEPIATTVKVDGIPTQLVPVTGLERGSVASALKPPPPGTAALVRDCGL